MFAHAASLPSRPELRREWRSSMARRNGWRRAARPDAKMREIPSEILATSVANRKMGRRDRRRRRNFLYLSRSALEELCRRRPRTSTPRDATCGPPPLPFFFLFFFSFLFSLLPSYTLALGASLPAASGVIDGLVHTLTGWSYRASCKEGAPPKRWSTSPFGNMICLSIRCQPSASSPNSHLSQYQSGEKSP